MSYLVTQQPATVGGTIRKFEPAYLEIDFNTGMNATLVTTGPNSVRLRSIFRTSNDLVGVYWRSVDKWDHPLFAYRPSFDYTNCVLDFDIAFPTSMPPMSDITKGLTMTVLDVGGNPYYVFVNNYKTSGGDYAGHIRLDFNTVKGGINHDVTIPWDRIESMFFGFTMTTYTDSPPHPIAEVHADVTFNNIAVSGTNSTLGLGNSTLAQHELCAADGFDDGYPQTPERIVNQLKQLGYSDQVIVYLGFSHYESLTYISGRLQVDTTKPYINEPAQQWLVDYGQHMVANGLLNFCCSISFEVLAMFCPDGWSQADYSGAQAHSGWDPPSTFLSPCSTAAQTFLRDVSVAFVTLMRTVSGLTVYYQIGEPWWWDGSFGNTGPCIYDANTVAAYTAQTGLPVPTPYISSIYSDFSSPAQQAYAVWLQQKLGQATLDLRDAVKAAFPGTPCRVLFYTPQILDPASPLFGIINFPKAQWTYPAWDKVQVENYGVVTIGNIPLDLQTLDLPQQVLGYPLSQAEYFSGFNLLPTTAYVWAWVDQAVYYAEQKSYSTTTIWARPQICRDGWVFDHSQWPDYAQTKPAPVYTPMPAVPDGFTYVRRPVFAATGSRHVSGKVAKTTLTAFPSWEFTLTYEYLGSRDQWKWLQQLRGFWEQMAGQYGQFQYTDPEFNHVSAQPLGSGDGYNYVFTLVRALGGSGYTEPIGIVVGVTAVYLNGVAQPSGWVVSYDYQFPSVRFTVSPPPLGAVVTADIDYAFLCRFASDSQDFEEFMKGFHTSTGLTLRSLKP